MRNQRDAFSEFDDDAGLDEFVQTVDAENQEPQRQQQQEEMVPKSRLDEVAAERNALRQSREEMIRSMLDRSSQPAPMQEPGPPELPPGVDEEVATAVKPLLDHTLARERQRISEEILGQVESRYGRVLKESERDVNLREMERRVPGFRENFDRIQAEWNRLSQADQIRYGRDEVGMEAFAEKVIRLSSGSQAGLDGMAYSESTRHQQPQKPDMDFNDVWNLPEEEFERRFGPTQT